MKTILIATDQSSTKSILYFLHFMLLKTHPSQTCSESVPVIDLLFKKACHLTLITWEKSPHPSPNKSYKIHNIECCSSVSYLHHKMATIAAASLQSLKRLLPSHHLISKLLSAIKPVCLSFVHTPFGHQNVDLKKIKTGWVATNPALFVFGHVLGT